MRNKEKKEEAKEETDHYITTPEVSRPSFYSPLVSSVFVTEAIFLWLQNKRKISEWLNMPRETTNETSEVILYSLIEEVTVLSFMYKFKKFRPSTIVPEISWFVPLKFLTSGLGVQFLDRIVISTIKLSPESRVLELYVSDKLFLQLPSHPDHYSLLEDWSKRRNDIGRYQNKEIINAFCISGFRYVYCFYFIKYSKSPQILVCKVFCFVFRINSSWCIFFSFLPCLPYLKT